MCACAHAAMHGTAAPAPARIADRWLHAVHPLTPLTLCVLSSLSDRPIGDLLAKLRVCVGYSVQMPTRDDVDASTASCAAKHLMQGSS